MTPSWGIWSAEMGWRMPPTSVSPAGFPGFKRTESEAGAPELPCGLSAWELGGTSFKSSGQGSGAWGQNGLWGPPRPMSAQSHLHSTATTSGQKARSVPPAWLHPLPGRIPALPVPQRGPSVESTGSCLSQCRGGEGSHGVVGPGRKLQRPEDEQWSLDLVLWGLVPCGQVRVALGRRDRDDEFRKHSRVRLLEEQRLEGQKHV